MPNTRYIAEIDARIAGIPCLIGVLAFSHTPGTYSRNADCPDDYYGSIESDWVVLDRRGRPAAWLERKLDDNARSDVESRIFDFMQ